VVLDSHERHARGVYLTGSCCGAIKDIKPAKDIIDEMVQQAVEQIAAANSFLVAKL